MANWSKLQHKIKDLPCKDLAHPWTDNCFLAAAQVWLDCCVGSIGFFGLFYLLQYVSRVLKKRKKSDVKEYLWMHIRSTCFGATVSATTVATHCLLRKLFGRFYYLTLIYIPAFVGGYSIYIANRKSRELFTNGFSNCCLDLCIKELEHSKILRWNSNIQTVIFMVLCSFVSFLLSSTNLNTNCFWFFLPPKVNKVHGNQICFHSGDCLKNISNLFVMYSSTGFILQFLKLALTNLKNPKLILASLKSPKTFRLGAFLGGYAVVYQAIRCLLYRKEKRYSLTHDSLAGFLAGTAFRFQPTITIFNSAVVTAIQILTELGCEKKIIPIFPYLETVFAFCCALLFHNRLLGLYCPRIMIYFMSGVTHGFSDRIYYRFRDIEKQFQES